MRPDLLVGIVTGLTTGLGFQAAERVFSGVDQLRRQVSAERVGNSIKLLPSDFHQVGDVLGKVRRDGNYHSLKSFITPNEPLVQELASILYSGGNFVKDTQDFIHSEIKYKKERGDFWKLPVQSLIDGYGDCEDTSLVITSLLRNFIGPEYIYCVVGEWRGDGHCWVIAEQRLIESTRSSRVLVRERGYKPYVFFNDQYAWAVPSDFDFLLIGQRYCLELMR